MGLNFPAVQIYSDAAFNSLAPKGWEQLQSLGVHGGTAALSVGGGTWDVPVHKGDEAVAAETGFDLLVCALRLKGREISSEILVPYM